MSKDNAPQHTKMNGESLDVVEQRKQELKQLFPSAFTETVNDAGELVESLDFERLKAELGEFSDVFEGRREKYGMEWPGKREALKLIQEPSRATLKPCREESVDFDNTENLFIEGDNLEVLKLLQKSYYGKVKMIYIDPPYNTGKEFIYPDKYSESLDTYLSYAGLVDDDGRKFTTNTAAEGRFHTKWLNMMYPRLYLARNLLREDGVIFISIDDNEVENLRRMCDEIFGEENFIGNISWKHTQQSKNDERYFSRQKNMILVYRKSISLNKLRLPRTHDDNRNYSNPDNDPKGDWRAGDVRSPSLRENLKFLITTPSGQNIQPPSNGWRWSKDEVEEKISSGEIIFSLDEERIIRKIYLYKQEGRVPENIWAGERFGTTRKANKELKDLFQFSLFETPKPTDLIKSMIDLFYLEDEFIVMDFFAGSSSTAAAALQKNLESSGGRKYIMIQLPEPCEEKSEAFKAGYKTIADIGKERIRRVAKKIQQENPDYQGDLGFKVLKLDQSNFKQWQAPERNISDLDLVQQMELHIDHVQEQADPEAILYELLIKAGFMPTEKVETITMAGKTVYSVAEGGLLVCLENVIENDLVQAIADAEPAQFICLDKAFQGNDQLKANAVQTFKSLNQSREVTIEFRTV